MTLAHARERLLTQPVGGRYGVFLGLGTVLSLAGILLFVLSASPEPMPTAPGTCSW